MKDFFNKIHTERFRWYDEILLATFISVLFTLFSPLFSILPMYAVTLISDKTDPFFQTFRSYFLTVGAWILPVLVFIIVKHRRPLFKAIGTKPKGNNIRYLLLGLLIGFGLNFTCALLAILRKDIHLSLWHVEPLKILALLFAVFVQSSSEELIDRCYLYQVIRKGYRSKWLAILWNSLVFSLLHSLNPGVTVLSLVNIFFSGLMFSLFVYYFDSLWCAFGIHTGWNFTQSILLGLPNSGLVVPYSVFQLDTAAASNSFVYDIAFGIEGTIFSTILLAVACLIIYLIGSKRKQEPLDIWS
ncbi:MAG: CPBP family intramembrane metalloprotease [Erysipelotrichaceae bacterium]|nr:CPBP family intramembrane metalloprotease [Erysipelotrichaceae bacterium]